MSGAPAPLASHQLLVFLAGLAVLVSAASGMGRVATMFRLPAVVGELVAGILLGPTVLGHTAPAVENWLFLSNGGQLHLLDAVGQIGVLLLVGLTGTEIDHGLVRRHTRAAIAVGASGLLLPLMLGVATGFLLPATMYQAGTSRVVFAAFLGIALCISSIPVIAKIFTDMDLLHYEVSQLTLTAAMIDDVVGWLLLSVVSAMALHDLSGNSIAAPILRTLLVVVVAATAGTAILRPILKRVARTGTASAAVVVVTAAVLIASAGTQALGLEAMFGAFVVGVIVGGQKHATAGLTALRSVVLSVFAPLFFAIAGLRIDLTALAHRTTVLTAVAVLAVAMIGKFGGAFLGGRIGRLNRWESLALGAGMNARGIVQIVIATAGLRLGVLNAESYTVIILVAVTTSMSAPPLLRFAMRRIVREDATAPHAAAHDVYDAPVTRRSVNDGISL